MRYLGIDYGEKRIGLAMSDPGALIAFPKKTLLNFKNQRALEQLKTLITEEKISGVVVGLPIALDGRYTAETQKALDFGEMLKKELKLPLEYENEMLTTHFVEQSGVKKEHTDAAAAAVILQSYLDKRKK